jgi:hypothetical protein
MMRKFTKFACQGVLAVVFGAAAIPVIEAKGETMKPVEKPITGEEPLTDLSQPEQALVQFYKAFNTRDIGLIDQNFATTDEVAIDNPLGGIRRGADQPHKMYQGIFASPRTSTWSSGITPSIGRGTSFGLLDGNAVLTETATTSARSISARVGCFVW